MFKSVLDNAISGNVSVPLANVFINNILKRVTNSWLTVLRIISNKLISNGTQFEFALLITKKKYIIECKKPMNIRN